MEELGFFNEREAECFEREDTLSQSDLEKLNVDENMPEMERVEKLLKTGLDKQKISVLASLPRILASNNTKTNLVLVLDCMKGVWQKYESEMNADPAVLLEIFKGLASLACATVDGKVLNFPTVTFHEEYAEQLEVCRTEKKNTVFLLTDDQVAKLLVPFALDMIAEIQQKDFAEQASLAVIALLPRIGSSLKKTQILRVAIEKGDVSQTPGSRLICCFILGAVTALNLLSAPDIEGLYFHKMMALCQDTDEEVRRCMCIQLDGLARAVGEEHACSELLPELLELLQDEEEQVKQTAFLALLSLVDFFPARDRVKLIIPEFINVAESQPDYLVHSLAKQMGILVTKLAASNHLGNDTGPVFLQSYSRLCGQDDVDLRQLCAYNFPAMVKAFGAAYTPTLMDDLFVKLVSDLDEEVRHRIAAGIHEVATLLGQQRAYRYLKRQIISLMSDESPTVQGKAISRVPQLLSVMVSPNDEEQKTALLECIMKAVVDYHGTLPSGRNRDQLVFLETLQSFPSWFSSIQIYEMVIPILFDFIEDGARPVQLLAMHVVLKCIRYNDTASHRYSLLSRLRNEYGHSKSYWRRILYLDACAHALSMNSRLYCQRNFLEVAIDLLDDPVPNVRLKAISLVPLWKTTFTYLSDEKSLDRIRQFLDETTIDSDRDVAHSLHEARQVVEASNYGQPRRPPDDVEDKRKLAEEESLGLMTDHEDSSADSKWSSMLEYTLVVGKDGQVVRRARVKSFDLVNKIARVPGKDTGRSAGLNGSSGLSGGLGMGSNGSSSMGLGMSMGVKLDSKSKPNAPKTPNKPGPTLTTLPNCTTARPGQTKMPQAIKAANATGKIVASGNKSVSGPARTGTGLSKDVGAITKIPIIRPSAPAKRETSPSTSTKPSSASLTFGSGSGRLGSIDNSAVKPPKPGAPAAPKR